MESMSKKICGHCGHADDRHDAEGECWWVSFNPNKNCHCSKGMDEEALDDLG
jgi:hypothetical protein